MPGYTVVLTSTEQGLLLGVHPNYSVEPFYEQQSGSQIMNQDFLLVI